MGWRAGPVRVIRATWGADSSTNNVRTETFYRDEVRTNDDLRVHVIPPADGIYSQWDFNAGKVSTYYNPYVPNGVPVDGKNDEVFGNGPLLPRRLVLRRRHRHRSGPARQSPAHRSVGRQQRQAAGVLAAVRRRSHQDLPAGPLLAG